MTMQNLKHISLLGCVLALAACIPPFCLESDNESSICFDDDGTDDGEAGDLLCGTFDGVQLCVDVTIDDPRMEKAIEDGAFVVFTEEGTCPNASAPWDCFARYTIFDSLAPIQCRYCDGHGPPNKPQTLCNPHMDAWDEPGLIAAVTPTYNGNNPDCTGLPHFKAVYPYDSKIVCEWGVSCLDANTECGCECGDDRSTCSATQYTLNEQYYPNENLGGDDFNPGYGWELFCSGFPWAWNEKADKFVGTTCEWNQPEPEPGEIPTPFTGDRDVRPSHRPRPMNMPDMAPQWPVVPLLDVPKLVHESKREHGRIDLPDGTHVQKGRDGVWRHVDK